jgi:hypothetical protein
VWERRRKELNFQPGTRDDNGKFAATQLWVVFTTVHQYKQIARPGAVIIRDPRYHVKTEQTMFTNVRNMTVHYSDPKLNGICF